MKFINEKKRGQCVESELLGLQFSPISIAFYFSLPNIMFYPRLIRGFFLSFQIDIDLAISWPALLSIRKMKLYIVAFTLLVLCAGCSCTKVPGTSMEPEEATLQPANPAKRIQPLDLLKRIHKIQKRGINCPDGRSSCPSGDTCCLLSSNGYGCCPHLLTPFVAMTGSIAVRRVTAVVQAATVTNKEPVINLVIEL